MPFWSQLQPFTQQCLIAMDPAFVLGGTFSLSQICLGASCVFVLHRHVYVGILGCRPCAQWFEKQPEMVESWVMLGRICPCSYLMKTHVAKPHINRNHHTMEYTACIHDYIDWHLCVITSHPTECLC